MASWTDVPPGEEGGLPAYRLFTGDVEKPAADDRAYRVLALQNGLRALLVRDPQADMAAACVALAIGHMHDPVDAQGMAHFCEHMILKGTEPYPGEGEYRAFVDANGGRSNGVTGAMSTDYWFSVRPGALAAGLSYLAACFSAPLFAPALAVREVRAVDAEFRRNAQSDARRALQLAKSLGVEGHPGRNFGTGNWESLSAAGRVGDGGDGEGEGGKEMSDEEAMKATRERLVAWWRATYCAARMTLVVLGNDSFEAMTSAALPLFSKIPHRGLDPRPAIKQPAWGPEHKGVLVFVQTVKDVHELELQFELPDLRAHYEAQPAAFIAHFLGHEGPGSACARLKRRGWLLALSAGASGHPRGVELFKVTCTLTLEGYLNYESVLATLYAHIALLRASLPLPAHHFEELASLAETRFRFRARQPPHAYVQALARDGAQPYPPERWVSGGALFRVRDEALVARVLAGFVPEEGRAFMSAKEHRAEVVGPDPVWETERWYGTRHVVRRMGEELLAKLRDAETIEELALPAPNPFIPTDLSVDKEDVAEPAKHPTLIRRTALAQLWHKKDDQFWMPKADVRIAIKNPLAYASARHATMSRLLVDLVEDALAEETYAAALAGLAHGLANDEQGISVSVGGYSDKLCVLLRLVLERLRALSVPSERLRVVKEKIRQEYANFYMGQPSNLTEKLAQWTFAPTIWTPGEKRAELDSISASDLERHRDDLLARASVDVLVNGNMSRERALDVLALVEDTLSPRPLHPSEIPSPRALVLPPGANVVVRRRHADPDELSGSLSYYCQFGAPADTRLRNVAALIHHIIREPCFTTLRTKEQLGYVVMALSWSVNASTLGLGFKLQSQRAPWDTEARVDAFLCAFRARLAALAPDALATQKRGLVAKMCERAKSVGEETARFWARVRASDCDFLRADTDAEVIESITLSELLAAYDAYLLPGSPVRRKLSVQLVSQQMPEPPSVTAANADADANVGTGADAGVVRVISELDGSDPLAFARAERAFKNGLACAPAAAPVPSPAFGEYGV